MFVDRVKVRVKAGRGGDGVVSFRREKYVPKGGPDGGNGGDGGDVIIEAVDDMLTLLDLKYRPYIRAEDGKGGGSNRANGRRGRDAVVRVPVGTIVRDVKSGDVIADLSKVGMRVVIARGGKGGRGNASFKSSTNQAPKWAEKGDIGEEKEIELELKIVADVGIVGLPNAGKSTLLSRLSNAKPKIAPYPFTTLYPNIGVMQDYEGMLVLADIPGLIEGASQGRGLGIDFLKHIERTRFLILLLDVGSVNLREVDKNYEELVRELRDYGRGIEKKKYVVVGNKIDLLDERQREELYLYMQKRFGEFFLISAQSGEGVAPLCNYLFEKVRALQPVVSEDAIEQLTVEFEPDIIVSKEGEVFVVRGKKVEQMCRMTDFENEDAVLYLLKRLRRMGLRKRLKRLGIKEGGRVRIGNREFLYEEVVG